MSRTTARTRTFTNTRTDQRVGESEDDSGPKCTGHGRRAKSFKAGPTTKNPGRMFYACPLGKDDPNKCKYFKWADELPGHSPGPVTPSKHWQGAGQGRQLQTPPQTRNQGEIDWSKVDTDSLEREALSTPSSTQRSQDKVTPIAERLQSASKRSLAEESDSNVTPVKRAHLDPKSPFVSSPIHPALSPSSHHLEEVSEHLHRQDRLIRAGEAAKEGFRRQITKLKEKNETLEARVKQLEAELEEARR